MMNPLSGIVVGSGAVIASPALWAALVDGTLPIETAVIRLGIGILIAWVGLSMLSGLLNQTSAPLARPNEPHGKQTPLEGTIQTDD